MHTIQNYVTLSAENNNKPLKKEKIIQKKKKSKGDKKNLYIKLTSNQKFDMAKNIIDNSNNRKQKYSEMFNMINSSIDEIKEILLYDYKKPLFKENYYETFNIKFPIKEILPFQDDISSITVYNFSESDITETKLIAPKKEEEKNTLKISKNDESSTIINDDSYSENKNLIQINSQQFQNQLNKGNTPNLSTVISTSNTNPNTNLYPNEKFKNKKIYTEGNNNNEQNKKNQLEKINELSRKYSQDESENEKKDCNIF